MIKFSLVVLNLGFIVIVLSALGEEMLIDHQLLATGVLTVIVGTIMLFASRKKEKKL